MDIVYDSDGLLITSLYRSSDTTVVTFAAFGYSDRPVPRNEYHKILIGTESDPPRRTVNIITVIDQDRKYYIDNRSSIVVREVNEVIRKWKSRRTVTIGLSMGGFAVVALTGRLVGAETAIAFGAHSSINPNIVPFDKRSPQFRSRIGHWDILDCLQELHDNVTYKLVYGQLDRNDVLHAARFQALQRRNIEIEFWECEHNVVLYWQSQGTLKENLLRLIGDAKRKTLPGKVGALGKRVYGTFSKMFSP